jgi:serine acetyltransferase
MMGNQSLKASIIGNNVEIGIGTKIIIVIFIVNNIIINAGTIAISGFMKREAFLSKK